LFGTNREIETENKQMVSEEKGKEKELRKRKVRMDSKV